jgi:quercetin dioxygenase-like cupin family protein
LATSPRCENTMRPRSKVLLTLSIVLTAIAAFAGSQLLVRFYSYRPHPAGAAKTTQVRLATAQAMPRLNGDSLKASIVEVTYPPGGESRPHTHPCAVIGYVLSGHYRSAVGASEERVYGPGDTFYEAPNGRHIVSRNASSTEPTKFLAYFLCDHDVPLSTDLNSSAGAGK